MTKPGLTQKSDGKSETNEGIDMLNAWARPRLILLIFTILGASLPGCPGLAAQPPIGNAPRASLCLNGEWEIAAAGDEVKRPDRGWTAARIPAAPVLDPKIAARWCRVGFTVPKEWAGGNRRVFVEFEKVGHYAAVFCNGQKVGEHFGQYTPFEYDLSAAVRYGGRNELAVFVHNASGKFVRPGADIMDALVCNAYRPAANRQTERNWVGIAGDVTLSWRPLHGIADVFVDTSVRRKTLTVHVETRGAQGGAPPRTLRASVFDEATTVLEVPGKPIAASGKTTLTANWTDPVLWGSAPYGSPKLCALRTELLEDGQVVDRTFTRFGFREVWISGRDVLLNGRKLWLCGTYHSKHSPLRDLNDRRPMAAMIRAMQSAGLNTLHGHWDDLGRPWLELCDEMGMFVLAGFFCDGRPMIQSRAGAGWADWMTSTCAELGAGAAESPIHSRLASD
jgi:beta-galactosidase/beta-glucuronidase